MKKVLLALTLLFCGNLYAQSPVTSESFEPIEVYHSEDLWIIQISENAFVHTSFLQTNDFGKVPCNGLVIRDSKEVVVFDTPTNNKSADALIQYIKEKLQCNIIAIIPTHFHDDCLGGLASFHEKKIPSYGNFSTIELTKANQVISPQNGFKDSQNLKFGNTFATVTFFGEGHTKDNVVGYFPKEKILFGGCLIKELEATKGYLGDANVGDWSSTVEKIKQTYPDVRLVIPGHGKTGGRELLDYTIQLFKTP
ncbi:subclass B1 metallo-beta-lactamase [Aquirufa salirivi]|uniref:beta-lactamase n=1 Tax=Aquirufa salirivi TaxID=3104729 RepID=A0ABW8RUD6_9BACT